MKRMYACYLSIGVFLFSFVVVGPSYASTIPIISFADVTPDYDTYIQLTLIEDPLTTDVDSSSDPFDFETIDPSTGRPSSKSEDYKWTDTEYWMHDITFKITDVGAQVSGIVIKHPFSKCEPKSIPGSGVGTVTCTGGALIKTGAGFSVGASNVNFTWEPSVRLIPLPAAFPLFGSGLVLVGLLRRWRKHANA